MNLIEYYHISSNLTKSHQIAPYLIISHQIKLNLTKSHHIHVLKFSIYVSLAQYYQDGDVFFLEKNAIFFVGFSYQTVMFNLNVTHYCYYYFQALYISDLFKKPPLWMLANKLTELYNNYGNNPNNAQYGIQRNELTGASSENCVMVDQNRPY